MEKAGRAGRVPARVELRRVAQQAAVAASDVQGFVATCRSTGIWWGCGGHGYKLARPGDVTAAGEPVFYSGSKLAPDLSLPRLQQRWATTPSARTPGVAGREPGASEVLEAVAAARAALRAVGEDGDGIASATADLLTALATGRGVQGWGERWGRRRTGSTGLPGHPADIRRSRVRWRDSCGWWPAACSEHEGPPEAMRSVGWRWRSLWPRWWPRSAPGRPPVVATIRPTRPAAPRRTPPSSSWTTRPRHDRAGRGRVGGTAGHGARHGRVEGRGGPAAGRTASPP
jgi:hypothetical protein